MLLLVLSLCLFPGGPAGTQTAEFAQKASNRSDRHVTAGDLTAAAAGEASAQANATLNRTQQEGDAALGHFGVSPLAGLRSFFQEQGVETRIIGGQEAWAHSWPWQVSLRFSSMPACGGAIISPLWVVSAAHCFRRYRRESLWTVLAGKHDLEDPQESGQQLVGVSAIVPHRAYNPRTKDADVALLRLQRPLSFGRYVRPIHLWMSPLPRSRSCTVTGWGSTRENGPRVHRLQEVNVSVLPPEDCDQYYSGRIGASMFCAGRDQGGADACQGDSGGPLSCFTGSRHQLAGLVSWGIGCGRAGRPGVYTRVQRYAQWMADTMNQQSVQLTDELPAEEDSCGRRPVSGCARLPAPAWISASQEGAASVGNVSESCPFLWPWQVSLQSNGRHYCSGVLIHRRWVLAAKHCSVRAKEDVVVLGVHDVRFLSGQAVLVDEVFSPSQDGGFPPRADLSLLRLSVAARLGPNVSPACVPEEDEELDDSWSCVTAGWGAARAAGDLNPDRLHHAALTLVNQTACRLQWGGFISDAHICCHPAGSASCMGDSGAPLFCQKRGTYFLFGVVSWGSWRCDATKPAVFTKVADFSAWIHEVTDNQ